MTIIDVDAVLHTIQDQAGVDVGPPAGVPNDAFYLHGTGVWSLKLGALCIKRVDVTESFLRLDGGEALASTHNAPAIRLGGGLSQHSELDGEHEMDTNPWLKNRELTRALGVEIDTGGLAHQQAANLSAYLEELLDLRRALVNAACGQEQYLYTKGAEGLAPSRGLIVKKALPGGGYPMSTQDRIRVADWGRPKHGFSPGLNIVDDPCSFAEGAAWLKQQHTAAMARLGAHPPSVESLEEGCEREAREDATDAARYRCTERIIGYHIDPRGVYGTTVDPQKLVEASERAQSAALDELAALGQAIEAEIEAPPPPDAKLVEALKKAEPVDAWSMIAKRYPKS